MQLAELNRLDRAQFAAQLGGIFEHSPWVAERSWPQQPFHSREALLQAMQQVVTAASPEEQLALIRAHPELAGREASEGTLTGHSSGEQARLGFLALTRAEVERMAAINRRYREKFGFPCIVALALHAARDSVVAEMERRLDNDVDTERAAALAQIGHIARRRLENLIDG